jgi:hypothetical protein
VAVSLPATEEVAVMGREIESGKELAEKENETECMILSVIPMDV